MFKNAKVGDVVFSFKDGWTTIKHINKDLTYNYPIYVEDNEYTLDGKFYVDDFAPTLYPLDLVPDYIIKNYPRPVIEIEEERTVYVNIYDYEDGDVFWKTKENAEKYANEDVLEIARPIKYTVKIKK